MKKTTQTRTDILCVETEMDAGATAATVRPQEKTTMKKTSTRAEEIEVTTTVETVTPEIASEWLAKNVGNRPINKEHVKRLAQEITSGSFALTHQGIAFDVNGLLIDGQHRLHAVVAANRSIRLQVGRGYQTETREKIDGGKVRNVANILVFRYGLEERESQNASALIHALFVMCGSVRNSIPKNKLFAAFETHRVALVWAFPYCVHARNNGVPTAILAALVWAYDHAAKQCEYIAEKFRKPTNLPEGSPVLVLHAAARKHTSYSIEDRRALSLKTLRVLEAVLDKESLSKCEASIAPFDRLSKRFEKAGK